MIQDFFDNMGILNGGDNSHFSATGPTSFHVDVEHSFQKPGPTHSLLLFLFLKELLLQGEDFDLRGRFWWRLNLRSFWHYLLSVLIMWRQDPMEPG